MSSRSKAREYALQILYEVDASGKEPERAVEAYWENFEASSRPPGSAPDAGVREFSTQLVRGVVAHREELDRLVERCSINWRLDRMPRVDRNVLRLAAFELTRSNDVPMKVVLNEAIELGKRYGSEESGAFINGILDKMAAEVGRE